MTSQPAIEQKPAVKPLLRPGQTCWRIERANRFALIVDAADYFRTLKRAILAARHSVMFIAWDFDTRIKLEPDDGDLEGPNRLGRFLAWIVRRRPELQVHVLKWDLGFLRTLGRGSTPLFILDWMTSDRMRFEPDRNHPLGAAHHQKIAIIDDAVAFCGGIDTTTNRWDTRRHLDHDDRRRTPAGLQCGPWHDATAAVDGAAARALGELARERWLRATGERLPPPPQDSNAWPAGLDATFRDIDVGIARTIPKMEEQEEVREIEALYLSAIAAARETIYIETQYLAARRIAEAIAARLLRPAGPEIVIVLPDTAEGWLEEVTMDSARTRLLTLVRAADRHGRFRAYYPVTEGGQSIYVHAKVMIVDDVLLRIGSSNLNNRSTGFDTECDLAVEAPADAPPSDPLRKRIRQVRDDLLAEHLGESTEAVASNIASSGSLIRAIENLRGPGRSLRDLPTGANGALEEMLAESDLVDPERPSDMWDTLRGAVGRG